MSQYWVYIVTNYNKTVLYTGITNNLQARLHEHRNGLSTFSSKYHTNILVYSQTFNTPEEAIIAEKKIKGWTRTKKNLLIESINPDWQDLSKP